MYQYEEEALKKELEKIENNKETKEKRLDGIRDILKNIDLFNEHNRNKTFNITELLLLLILAFISAGKSIGLITMTEYSFMTIGYSLDIFFSILLGASSILILGIGGMFIKMLLTEKKEIKKLKAKGIETFIKQKEQLKKEKEELKKEIDAMQIDIDKILQTLEKIDFCKEKENDILYQVDTKEEYEAKLSDKKKYEQLFEDYLNEKVDYSTVHLDDVSYPTLRIKLNK